MFLRLDHPIHGFKMLHIDEILQITTKSRRTVQHWIQRPDRIDPDSLKLIELYAFGILPTLSPDFERLYLAGNEIRSLDQSRFFLTASELAHVFLMYQMNAALRDENKVLRAINAKGSDPDGTGAIIYNFKDYKKEKGSAPSVA